MTWIGRYRLGDTVPLSLAMFTATLDATEPAPFVEVWSDSAKVKTLKLPIQGVFLLPLDATFAAGHYRAVCTYRVGGNAMLDVACFNVEAGGPLQRKRGKAKRKSQRAIRLEHLRRMFWDNTAPDFIDDTLSKGLRVTKALARLDVIDSKLLTKKGGRPLSRKALCNECEEVLKKPKTSA